jgi:hypothetical protein
MPLALRIFPGTAGAGAGGAAGSFNAGSLPEVAPVPKSGSRNPATDLRSCAESAASFAMEVDVAVDPSAVCDEISRTTCMFLEILPDTAACWRALAEMFCTRLAI